MNDDEWQKQRSRAILTAMQTGRPVFADSDGKLHYIDGAKEPVASDVGLATPMSKTKELAIRAERASRLTYVLSAIAAIANAVMALLWNTWQIAPAILLGSCAVIWYRINRYQRAAMARVQGDAR